MPYVNEDGTLDLEGGYITKCDRCGVVGPTEDKTLHLVDFWDRTIFAKRPKPNLGVFCYECAKAITPLVYALRDVDELKLYTNNLERAINEKRNQRN